MPGTHPQKRPLGYARVSTHGQTLDAQLEQLRKAGCTKIYRELYAGHFLFRKDAVIAMLREHGRATPKFYSLDHRSRRR